MKKPRTSRKNNPRPGASYDPASDFVRPRHLPQATGLSNVTIWRLRKRGAFPQPVQLTDNPDGPIAWRRGDIRAWADALPMITR